MNGTKDFDLNPHLQKKTSQRFLKSQPVSIDFDFHRTFQHDQKVTNTTFLSWPSILKIIPLHSKTNEINIFFFLCSIIRHLQSTHILVLYVSLGASYEL